MKSNRLVFGLVCLGVVGLGAPTGCGSSDSDTPVNNHGDGGSSGSTNDASAGGSTGGTAGHSGGNGGTAGGAGVSGGGGSVGGQAGQPDASAGSPQDAGEDVSPDVNFGYDAPKHDSTVTQDSACATGEAEATLIPLDIYLMLDATGSMVQGGSTKWSAAVSAINGFIVDPSMSGNRLALRAFSTNISSDCSGTFYANPLVSLVDLPGQAQQITDAMNGISPSGGTPTEGALRGVMAFTPTYQTAGRVMIGVIVTDGDPESSCNDSVSFLGTLAAGHYSATAIRIFWVGMDGATESNLETLAAGSGADLHTDYCGSAASCHYYHVGAGQPAAFIAALKKIQQSAIGCTYTMPTTDAGIIDPEQVTVEYTPNGTGTPQTFTNVDNESQCGANNWYYDDNNYPTQIILCPATCAVVQADTTAKVKILLGCIGH